MPAPDSERDLKKEWNRDNEQKTGAPGTPPRTAYEPQGSEGSARTDKTLTDPATGEPNKGPQAPNRSDADRAVDR